MMTCEGCKSLFEQAPKALPKAYYCIRYHQYVTKCLNMVDEKNPFSIIVPCAECLDRGGM